MMKVFKRIGASILSFGILAAQQPFEDPVLKAQASRAAVLGSDDLPPVPRGILEPPPLPPPVTHVRDTPGSRSTRTARKQARKSSRKAGRARSKAPVRIKKPVRKRTR